MAEPIPFLATLKAAIGGMASEIEAPLSVWADSGTIVVWLPHKIGDLSNSDTYPDDTADCTRAFIDIAIFSQLQQELRAAFLTANFGLWHVWTHQLSFIPSEFPLEEWNSDPDHYEEFFCYHDCRSRSVFVMTRCGDNRDPRSIPVDDRTRIHVKI